MAQASKSNRFWRPAYAFIGFNGLFVHSIQKKPPANHLAGGFFDGTTVSISCVT